MKLTKIFMSSLLGVSIFLLTGCQERPATPFPTANPTQDDFVQDLYQSAHDPWAAEAVIIEFGELEPEAQQITMNYYVDGYLQQTAFGLDRMRMELLKGLTTFYYYDIDPSEILDITRELPQEGSTGFAFLPPRTLVVLAEELHNLWQKQGVDGFMMQSSELFSSMGADSNVIGSYIRGLEMTHYFLRLENGEGSVGNQSLVDYVNPEVGIAMQHPEGWQISEFENGFSVISCSPPVSVSVLPIEGNILASELITVFRQEIQQSDPNLKVNEGEFEAQIEGADSQQSISLVYPLNYPTYQENMLIMDVIAFQQGDDSWVLFASFESHESDVESLVEELVQTAHIER